MTIVVHQTEASRLAHEVSKLNVPEIQEFVDILKKLEDITNVSGEGNFNFSAVKQRIAFNEYMEQQNG
jgi:hypothetical protein